MPENESDPKIISLDPNSLYTQETRVYRSGIKKVNLKDPIKFGKDAKGRPYVTDGNHKSRKAWEQGVPVLGQQVATAKFDVTQDADFRHISQLRVLES